MADMPRSGSYRSANGAADAADRFVTHGPHGSHILVIDDEPAIGTLVRNALCRDDVESFQCPRKALARARETLFDAVLCDFLMPEMTGIEVYEALATTSPMLATHFVLMTGAVEYPELQRFLSSTRVPLLQKPFGVPELEHYVRRAVVQL